MDQHPEQVVQTSSTQHSEYDRIMQQINDLRARADELRHQQRSQALRHILDVMRQHDITIEEIQSGKIGRSHAKRTTSATKAPAKYADPVSGATWTGRGRKPAWVVQALNSGKTLDDLRIAA